MIVTKYPDWIEAQLKILDERIESIYKAYGELKFRPDEAMRIKNNLYKQIQPFVDEKVRLIANSCPTYIVDGVIKKSEDKLCSEDCCFNDGEIHAECVMCKRDRKEMKYEQNKF